MKICRKKGQVKFHVLIFSWDTTWGENGYMRLARNRGNHCGITVETAYPVVVGSDDTTNDSNDEDSGK